MRPPAILTLIALAGLVPACGKIRRLADQLGKQHPAAASVGAAASDIPQEVLKILPGGPGRITIVDYYADWCGPCRMLSPILEKIADENRSTVTICKVNVDKFRDLAAQQGVSGIPDVRIYVDGKMKEKFIGALPEQEVRKRIAQLIATLPPAPPPATGDAQPKPTEPTSRPMPKDWLPPGVQRR